MKWDELKEAIPPTYSEWIGRQMVEAIVDINAGRGRKQE
jgi:hypothetical protein